METVTSIPGLAKKSYVILALMLILWVAAAGAGDILLKQHRLFDWRFAAGCVLYIACAFFAVYCFHRSDFGVLALFWNAVSIPASVAIALVVFHEPITMRRVLMFLFSVAAILCGVGEPGTLFP